MRKLFIIGFLLSLCGLVVSAQSKKSKLEWKTGKISIVKYQPQVGTVEAADGAPMRFPDKNSSSGIKAPTSYLKEIIRFEASDQEYQISRRIGASGSKKLKLGAGDIIKFAVIDGSYLYLINEKGKKIKYLIESKI